MRDIDAEILDYYGITEDQLTILSVTARDLYTEITTVMHDIMDNNQLDKLHNLGYSVFKTLYAYN